MTGLTLYVVGFAFSEDCTRVVLVKKKRPDWQAGKLNGVGGHIESGETPYEAVSREFKEETGVLIPQWRWGMLATLICQPHKGKVFFFSTLMHPAVGIENVHTVTDEEIGVYSSCFFATANEVIPSLHWLIPLALDRSIVTPVNFYEG